MWLCYPKAAHPRIKGPYIHTFSGPTLKELRKRKAPKPPWKEPVVIPLGGEVEVENEVAYEILNRRGDIIKEGRVGDHLPGKKASDDAKSSKPPSKSFQSKDI